MAVLLCALNAIYIGSSDPIATEPPFQTPRSSVDERVLLAFAKRNIPILPIHDSFLMHHGYTDELQDQMKIAFAEELDGPLKPQRRCSISWDLQEAHWAYQDRLDKKTRIRLAQQGKDPLEGMGVSLHDDIEPLNQENW